MKPLIVANWKCNPTTLKGAKLLFDSVKNGIKNIKNVEVVICPPFTQFSIFNFQFSKNLKLGAQNCFWEEKGAYTGEVSPKMLKDLGVEYVIIGHSERRRYLRETDEMINKKLKAVLRAKLKPILCIDNLSQLKSELKRVSGQVIIAYEPVFAIGTGKPYHPEKAKKMRRLITYPVVLYGGSVNSENASRYIEDAGFQGLLVGGASLNPEAFVAIVKTIDPVRNFIDKSLTKHLSIKNF